MVTEAAWGWEAGRDTGLPLTPQAHLSEKARDNLTWGGDTVGGGGLQRCEPSLMVSISYLDQGVNLLLLGEVFLCSLLPLLRALSSPTINAAERAESWNLVLDFCLKPRLCHSLPVVDP